MTKNFDMRPPVQRRSRFGDGNTPTKPAANDVTRSHQTAAAPEATTAPASAKRRPTQHSRRTLGRRMRDAISRLPLPTKYCPIRRYGLVKVLLTLGILAVLAVGGWVGYRWLTAPAHITDLHFERSLSSRTTDAPTKQEFTPGEPLMLVMSYTAAKPQTKATIIITKDSHTIRTIDIPQLRGDDTTPDNGKRYVSLVNGGATKLDPGHYTARIVLNGSYTATTGRFTVK